MKYSILIPRGESAMIKNITLLDSILDVAVSILMIIIPILLGK